MTQSMTESEDEYTYIQLNGSAERMIQSSTESDDESKHSSESEVDSDRYMALFMLTLYLAKPIKLLPFDLHQCCFTVIACISG